MKFLRRHRSKILTWIALGMPIAVGVATGGVTLPAILTGVATFAGKLAATPMDHSEKRRLDVEAREARRAKKEIGP